jgi:hypothetical protein
MADTDTSVSTPTAHTNAPMPSIGTPTTGVSAAMARLTKMSDTVDEQFSDVKRICSIPITRDLTPEELEEFNRRNIDGAYFDAGFRLFEPQARAILFFDRYGGVFAPISCGGGKTLLSLMIAERHWRRNQNEKILYLVPPEVYPQLVRQIGTRPSDLSWARRRVQLTIPSVGLGGLDAASRMARATGVPRGLFIMPHSLMSTRDSSALLEAMNPSLVILDEAHRFKNRSAARTKRLMDFVHKKLPKLVVLSGSITNKSLRDYHHFLKPCLGVRSPLPFAQHLAMEWALVMDSDANPTDAMKKPVKPLVDWARFFFRGVNLAEDVSGFRKAHKLRMSTCPGVVSTVDSGVPCTLLLVNAPTPHEQPGQEAALEALVTKVEKDWETPNGDPIDHAIHKYHWLQQLSAGFYYELKWPTVSEVCRRRGVSKIEAEDFLKRSKDCLLLHGDYAKALRKWSGEHHRAGLDTPWLVGQEMSKHGPRNVGAALYAVWRTWKNLADALGDDLIERDSVPVRVCDFKIRATRTWVRQLAPGTGALLWVFHQEVGEWLVEVLKADGKDVLHCPAGDAYNKAIIDPVNSKKIIVASMTAHGTGKNLQHFDQQAFVQWPRSASLAEQTLARTHRPGQEADELRIGTFNTTASDKHAFAACLRDACYVQQSTGSRQKVLMAQYDPLPEVFSHAVLAEMGLQPQRLDAKGEEEMKDKFGG